MTTIRLTQTNTGDETYSVLFEVETDGQLRQAATSSFEFHVDDADREDLRWYLEDYLQYPADPAPQKAARVEQRIREIGKQLFDAVFLSNADCRKQWDRVSDTLNSARIEITTDVAGSAELPWELLFDSHKDSFVALQASTFVRSHRSPTILPKLPEASEEVRILLVICRPSKDEDIPFRSVANKLLAGLGEAARTRFQLDVLRPPTYEQLARTLRQANSDERPYHVVHFDGHGMYEDASPKDLGDIQRGPSALMLSGAREGKHGYLLFEDPDAKENIKLVDGPTLGGLLVDTNVPVLVLNACRSAHADQLTAAPGKSLDKNGDASPDLLESDPHGQTRAFGTLAQEVMDKGVSGIVAMRFTVYVVTAAQFVADLYAALASGQALGTAVTQGRKLLADSPKRELAFEPIPLQDWLVPVVYEAAPLVLFPKTATTDALDIKVGGALPGRGDTTGLPEAPDSGFFGRDGTILSIDRAFDRHSIVLLHGYAGAGKTMTAAEFGRWYSLTGGVQGPVLFTSFERARDLSFVLGELERLFGASWQQAGVDWVNADEKEKLDIALRTLDQVPVLWIWDNVEAVSGIGLDDVDPSLSEDEQRDLVDFLRAARSTKAKFLLTSRTLEKDWLGELPFRVSLPPMPLQESMQLVRALVDRHGRAIRDVEDWLQLLRFTGGNPLTITVIVGEVLRQRLKTSADIETFIAEVQAGESDFKDEVEQGRSKSLFASLSYGFVHAFDESERERLALLHLFRGYVNKGALQIMTESGADWAISDLPKLGSGGYTSLLDRAADVGLLAPIGDVLYSIHPALPWFFASMFRQYYPESSPDGESKATRAKRAYMEAMGVVADQLANAFTDGDMRIVRVMQAEEANFLHALYLARAERSWKVAVSMTAVLCYLYEYVGRGADWKRLVVSVMPEITDEQTGRPLPEFEVHWARVAPFAIRQALQTLDRDEAERLQTLILEVVQKEAASILIQPDRDFTDDERVILFNLAGAFRGLGDLQASRRKPECLEAFSESIRLAKLAEDVVTEAGTWLELGNAYKDVPEIRDLDLAENAYRRSLELRAKEDKRGRGRSMGSIGQVAQERFWEARRENGSESVVLKHLNDAASAFEESLTLLPNDSAEEVANTHVHLGEVYGSGGVKDRALKHFQDAIRIWEQMGDSFKAAGSRFLAAKALGELGSLDDAIDYAEAAKKGFEAFGPAAADQLDEVTGLIRQIRDDIGKRESPE